MNISSFVFANTVNIRVVFPFKATNVVMHLWGSINQDVSLVQSGKNEFSKNIDGDIQQMIFYIDYNAPEYSTEKWYLSGGGNYTGNNIPNRFDAHGLKYGKVYINNQLIDNSYTVLNNLNNGLNISVKVNADNSVSPLIDATNKHLYIDDRIPTEVHHRNGYLNISLPASYHRIVTGWMQALSDNNIIDTSRIDVDYLRLYGKIGKDSILIASKEYGTYDSANDGGLYSRYPFFPEGDKHTSMPGEVSNGVLTFYPSDNIHKVWHWWTGNTVSTNAFTYDSYKLVCRLRITGKAIVQAGIDFKTIDSNINELGVSEWYFEKNGEWQDVVFDSKNYTTTSLKTTKNSKKAGVFKFLFLKDSNAISIQYEDVAFGEYTLSIYNTNGQKAFSKIVEFKNSTGNISIPFKTSEACVIYEFRNQSNTYSGKIIL